MKSIVTVGVHSGTFHADDVFSIAALQRLYKINWIRTRDQNELMRCGMLVDVGGVYDPEICRFDHHQRSFTACRANGIPYAGFGLIWKHYGTEICGSAEVAKLVDRLLVQPIDADDNGVKLCKQPLIEDVEMYTVSQLILDHNPRAGECMDEDTAFYMTLTIASRILDRVIKKATALVETIPAIVRQAIEEAGGDPVIVLAEDCGRDWQETLIREAPEALFVVFQVSEEDWRVHAVPLAAGTFKYRLKLPESWRGLPPELLADTTGVADVKFCHKEGFIAAAKSKAGAIRLAELTLIGNHK